MISLDFDNPAVAFLVLLAFGGWTMFTAWAFSESDDDWPKITTMLPAVVSLVGCIWCLLMLLYDALTKTGGH